MKSESGTITKKSSVYEIFLPIINELKCAIAARDNRFDTFPGKEIYLNLKLILSRLKGIQAEGLPGKVRYSLRSLLDSLEKVLNDSESLYSDICSLYHDIQWLKAILSHRKWSGERIKKWVTKWLLELHKRLEKEGMEHETII